jgi:tripartite-type tricarboxylate transporter receptor subunit TctC
MPQRPSFRHVLSAAVVALCVAVAAPPALAYPDRPIQLLVGFTPGGNIDIAARLAAPFLERQLGNGAVVTVVNRPGAGGMIMLNEVAAGPADGHAVAFLALPALVTALYDSTPRYRRDSFAYVGLLTDEPYTLYVAPDSPYRSLADLVAAARARPETITIAGAGFGGTPHLALMAFERIAGVRFTWVPTQGAAQAFHLVAGGHVVGSVSTVSLTVKPHREGQARILGLMDAARWERTPELPTFREQGFDMTASSARGFALRAGTPDPILRVWEEAVRRVAADPEFRALAERDHVIVRHLDRAAMTAVVAAQDAHYADLWRRRPWRQ